MHEQERKTNPLVTRTYATFVRGVTRPGPVPGTIQVLPLYDQPFFDRHRVTLKSAGFEPITLDTPNERASNSAEQSELRRLEEKSLQLALRDKRTMYQLLDESPLAGASFSAKRDDNLVDEFALGFPFRSRWTADWTYSISGGCVPADQSTTRWIASPWNKNNPPWTSPSEGITAEYGFPTGLIPLGFAANTTIYAVAWFSLLSIPAFIRSRVATHKNLCANCRYDLRGLAANASCPECGTARKAT